MFYTGETIAMINKNIKLYIWSILLVVSLFSIYSVGALETEASVISTVTVGGNATENLTVITIYSPLAVTYTTTNITINFTATDDDGIDSLWYYNGSTNKTYTNVTSEILAEGSHTFVFYANDTNGNITQKSRTFSIATPSDGSGPGGITDDGSPGLPVPEDDEMLINMSVNQKNIWYFESKSILGINTYTNDSFGTDVEDIDIEIAVLDGISYTGGKVERVSMGYYEVEFVFSGDDILSSKNITVIVTATKGNVSLTDTLSIEVRKAPFFTYLFIQAKDKIADLRNYANENKVKATLLWILIMILLIIAIWVIALIIMSVRKRKKANK